MGYSNGQKCVYEGQGQELEGFEIGHGRIHNVQGLVTYHESYFSGKNTTHRVSNQYHIGGRRLMRNEPLAEVIAGDFDCPVGLVARVNLGVDDMRVGESRSQVRVNMMGEGFEGLFVAIEAVDVDKEKCPTLVID